MGPETELVREKDEAFSPAWPALRHDPTRSDAAGSVDPDTRPKDVCLQVETYDTLPHSLFRHSAPGQQWIGVGLFSLNVRIFARITWSSQCRDEENRAIPHSSFPLVL